LNKSFDASVLDTLQLMLDYHFLGDAEAKRRLYNDLSACDIDYIK
jgi:hypothetical protein